MFGYLGKLGGVVYLDTPRVLSCRSLGMVDAALSHGIDFLQRRGCVLRTSVRRYTDLKVLLRMSRGVRGPDSSRFEAQPLIIMTLWRTGVGALT